MLLYSLPFDVISEVVLYLDIIDLKKLEVAGPKNQLDEQYLKLATENYTVDFYFYGTRKVVMPYEVLLGYLDKNIGFTELVLPDSKDSVPDSYGQKLMIAASVLRYLSIPCTNTFQEREFLSCSLGLETLRISNAKMKAVQFHIDFDFSSVTALDLSNCSLLCDFSSSMIGFHSLTHLDVSRCFKIGDAFMIAMLRVTTKLEVINMCHCVQLTDATLYEICDIVSIKQLGIVGCSRFSKTAVRAVPLRCPNFTGFLEDTPVVSVKRPLDAFGKAAMYYDSSIVPIMEAVYIRLQPYDKGNALFMFLMCFNVAKHPYKSEKWYRLMIILLSTGVTLFTNFMSFMKYRHSLTMKWISIVFLVFSVVMFSRNVWFVVWDDDAVPPQ